MKRFNFKISKAQIDTFFPHERIKSKAQVLEIILEATRFMMYSKSVENVPEDSLVLVVDKMSRLFFKTHEKTYSLSFPFVIIENDEELVFSIKNGLQIDSVVLSNLLEIIKSDYSYDIIDFADFVDNLSKDSTTDLWSIFYTLWSFEDSYFRYDNDYLGYEKAKQDGNEHLHPLHHIDFSYSQSSSFKLGLKKEESIESLIDFVNIRSSCRYLLSP